MKDTFMQSLIAKSKIARYPQRKKSADVKGNLIMPHLYRVLRKYVNRRKFRTATSAIRLLSRSISKSGFGNEYRRHFITDMQLYESDPLLKLNLVHMVPGPLYVVAYSIGGPAERNVASKSIVVSKAILLAPYFGRFESRTRTTILHFTCTIAVLDI